MSATVQPLYAAYAAAHGFTPDEQRAHDEAHWPGGRMAGFLLWMGEQWAAFDAEHGYRPNRTRPPEEIAAFSAWLEAEADDAGPWRSDMLSEDWDE